MRLGTHKSCRDIKLKQLDVLFKNIPGKKLIKTCQISNMRRDAQSTLQHYI